MSKRVYLVTTFSGFDGGDDFRFATHTYAFSPDDVGLEVAMDERGKEVYKHQVKYGWTGVRTTRITYRESYSGQQSASRVLMESCDAGDEEIMREVRRYQARPTPRNRVMLEAILEDNITGNASEIITRTILNRIDKSVVCDEQ